MIITIVSIALLVASLVLFHIEDECCFPNFLSFLASMFMMIVGGLATFICVIALFSAQVNKDIDYQNALYEKEMLEYRIDHADEDIVGNELLYNDIVEFNNGLRTTKKYANSYWTNWLFNEDIATIDYIELDKE